MIALTERMLAGWRDGEPPGSGLIERLPLPSSRRLLATRARLDHAVYDVIARRRAQPDPGTDLLGLLVGARDTSEDSAANGTAPNGTAPGGGALPDRQVRDEVVTILMAGHETTANALTWTWHLLAESPDVEAELHAELDSVLAGRPPGAGDMAGLDLARRVITESMRLYPPVWITTRRLLRRRELGGVDIPPPALLLISPWLLHRDPQLFPNPERFDPDRWSGQQTHRPRYAYLPFGAGPRQCIGNGFAITEAVMVLATTAQRWSLRPLPGRVVVPQPLITLRPRDGLPARVHQRRRASAERPAEA